MKRNKRFSSSVGLFLTLFLKPGRIITDLSPVETDDFSKVSVVSRLRILEGYREEFKVIFGYIYIKLEVSVGQHKSL